MQENQKDPKEIRHRCSNEELEERLDLLYEYCIEMRLSRRQLAKVAMERWGINKRTAYRYLASLEERFYSHAHKNPGELLSQLYCDIQLGINQAIKHKDLAALALLVKASTVIIDKMSKSQLADYGHPIGPKYKATIAKNQPSSGVAIWLPDNGRGGGPLPSRIGPPPA